MILNGQIMVKGRNGIISEVQISDIISQYKTFQILTMNSHGQEPYSFSLIDKIIKNEPEENQFYEIRTINNYDIIKTIICDSNSQIFILSKRWSGFISTDKLKKNDIVLDNEDRLNRVISISKKSLNQTSYNINVMYTNNFFYNGILIR